MTTPATTQALGTTWFFGCSATRPKQTAIDNGVSQQHKVFIERVTERGRQFGSYASADDMVAHVGQQNLHFFEIIPDQTPCKLYLDLEWEGLPGDLHTILNKLQIGCSEILGVSCNSEDFRISCASGLGESATFKDKHKQSFHLVVDNGWVFPHNKACSAFVNMVFADDPRVDKVPYQKNQSFKLVYSSKLGSLRVQLPLDGYRMQDHMVTAFKGTPQIYKTDRLEAAITTHIRQQVVRPRVTIPACHQQPFVEDPEDVFSVPTLLSYLPNGPGDAKQPFSVFLTVACICVNESQPFEIFERWAARYPKYSRVKSQRIWNSLSRRLDGYDLHTLRAMVSQINPTLFRDMDDKYVHQCLHPTIDYAQHGYDYISYSEPRMEPWLDHLHAFKHIVVRGAMGAGKTHQLINSIKEIKPSSVLVVTPRQLFARSMLGTLRGVLPALELYQNIPQDRRVEHDFIVVQVESLWTLGRTYDMVVLDESESILYQFTSPTVRHFEWISEAFENIVVAARKVVWSDAFITDRSLVVCEELDPQSTRVFINNKWVPTGRKAYNVGSYMEAKCGLRKAANHLRAESNVVVSASKQLATEIAEVLQTAGPTLLVCADSDDKVKARLEDVNTFLKPYQNFCFTSAITVGMSYDSTDHFDNLLLYTSACSCNVRDSMQATMRIRNIKSQRLFYGSYPRYFGTDRFDCHSRGRLMAMIEGRDTYAANFNEMYQKRGQLRPWQKKLWVFCTQEDNVSAFIHLAMVKAYLQLCGYELQGYHTTSLLDDVEANAEDLDYHEIPDVSVVVHDQLGKAIERCVATTNDKVCWLKGNFKYHVLKDAASTDPSLLTSMFKTYAKQQMGIHMRLNNRRAEKNPEDVDELLSVFQDNTKQKVDVMRRITGSLGIEGSWAIGSKIDRAKLAKTCENVLAMKHELKDVFDLRLRERKRKKSDNDTFKRGLELLNGCTGRFGFTIVARDGPQRRQTVGGSRLTVNDYVVQEAPGFKGFGEHTRD